MERRRSFRRRANAAAVIFGVAAATAIDLRFGAQAALRFALELGFGVAALNFLASLISHYRALGVRRRVVDPVSGALNRACMALRLEAAIERQARLGAPSAILRLDVDHFDSIAGRLGPVAAERVLRRAVACMQRRLRALDLLFALDAGSFVALLPETGPLEAAGLGEDLRRAIATTHILEQGTVTATMGVSQVRPDDTVEGWIARAEMALAEAKRGGRDRVLATSTRTPAFARVLTSVQRSIS
jgi:diguanylate cyclase (GGDEF)-like protein